MIINPEVSIVIPVFNAEKFLHETLTCIQNQTFKNFECVLVNDGSTDNSLKIIEGFIRDDDRFRVISVPNNGCANIPRNIAIRNSTGMFVFNLDADDLIEVDTIEKIVQRQRETSADIVILRMIGCATQTEGEIWRLPLSDFDMNQVLEGKEACRLTIGKWLIPCNGMLVKRDLFQNVPEGKYFISDEIASRHLLYKSNKVAFAETNYLYRNNNESITRSITAKLFDRLLTDEILNRFVDERFELLDPVNVLFRNTRLFNLIYLQHDYIRYRKSFDKSKSVEIAVNFVNAYNSQKIKLLKKELPFFHSLLFTSGYTVFKIASFLYVLIKDRKGRKYQMK